MNSLQVSYKALIENASIILGNASSLCNLKLKLLRPTEYHSQHLSEG